MQKGAVAVSLSLALSGACAVNPAVVPLTGSETDVSHLVGEWVGEFESAETGRIGSIVFTLAAEADTAYGDVVMIPPETGKPISRLGGHAGPARDRASTQLLTIRFVQVADHHVSGALDPYQDPQCGCTLLTTFEGDHTDDRIEGTFISRHSQSGKTSHGTWWVGRKK